MKKKRVKYLAIIDSFESTSDYGNYDYKELVSLKDEVEEFKLYDIKVQSHKSLMSGNFKISDRNSVVLNIIAYKFIIL
uniref:Uncharacterized protein n=1 Tax=Rhizophagus irregularis (strain DAOM 181602 / DAOM 197198 / MUCL 43194) TaxID=747089 RepID=U9UHP5_RHIID